MSVFEQSLSSGGPEGNAVWQIPESTAPTAIARVGAPIPIVVIFRQPTSQPRGRMYSVLFEIVLILLLVIANGVFAMSEMAMMVARKSRLQELANGGSGRARAALDLASSPDRFLSTVQIGITLVGILAGAFGGARIAQQIAVRVALVSGMEPYATAIGIAVVVLSITFVSLVLGELVPKRIALKHPERVAMLVARPMRMLSRAASPVVSLLSFSTDVVARILGIRPPIRPTVTEAEIKVLVEEAANAGVLEEKEHELVKRIFRFGDRGISAFMTPRRDIIWLDTEDDDTANCVTMTQTHFSRFLVCDGSIDNVLGVVIAKEFLAARLIDSSTSLREHVHEPLVIPETADALGILDTFKRARIHLAVIVDEHHSTVGIVTSNDILEAIIGDMLSPDGIDEPDAVQREDGSWLIDAAMPVDEFTERFAIRELPGESRKEFRTAAGFILSCMGRVPSVADRCEWQGLRFEVMDMDGKRIDKILVTPAPAPDAPRGH